MPHLDQSELIQLVIDEDQESAGSTEHLAGCTICRHELDQVRELFTLVGEAKQVRDLPPPPDRVWAAIAAEIGTAPAPPARAVPAGYEDLVDRAAARVGAPPDSIAQNDQRDDAGGGRRTPKGPLDNRPGRGARRSWRGMAVTAALAVTVALAGVLGGVWLDRNTEPAPPPVLASAQLAAYGPTPKSAAGEAEVLDGGRLALHVTGLPATSGYYEVWLIDPATFKMFSIGTLGAGPDGEFTLPTSADLGVYRVVDVSAEQFDNNSAHSGDSLLRGTLTPCCAAR